MEIPKITEKESGRENKENLGRLVEFIRSVSRELREKENVPVGPDGRIDMSAFPYPDAAEDIRRARAWQVEWLGNLPEEEMGKKRLRSEGEQLELLAHAVLYKNLGKDFIVVRSSLHDDRKNGVDTILLEKKTGNLICAFDEVGSSSGADFETKQQKVFSKNANEQGARLKYGITYQNGGIKLETAENLPIFYIALPADKINKGIQEFNPSPEQSDFEKKLFDYFIATLRAQAKGLRLYTARLDEKLKKRLDIFEKALDSR